MGAWFRVERLEGRGRVLCGGGCGSGETLIQAAVDTLGGVMH